jgi:hypothetical protein
MGGCFTLIPQGGVLADVVYHPRRKKPMAVNINSALPHAIAIERSANTREGVSTDLSLAAFHVTLHAATTLSDADRVSWRIDSQIEDRKSEYFRICGVTSRYP